MRSQRFIALLCAIITLVVGSVALPLHVFAQALVLPDGTLIKASGPEIDLMQGGYRRWIPDPTTFACMGLSWSAVQTITDSAWKQIPAGTAYPSRANGTLLQGSGPAVYVMNGCQRHWIPDVATFNADGYKWSAVQRIADADLQAIPLGAQIPEINDLLTSNRYQQVGWGFRMQTNVSVVKHSGQISAVTHTWDTNAFWGFTGGVQIWLLDKNGKILVTTPAHTFNVTSRYKNVAKSDRTDTWSAPVDPNIAAQATAVQIVQYIYQVNWPGTNKSAVQTITSTIGVAFPRASGYKK